MRARWHGGSGGRHMFGEKWLSNRFAERLEASRHDQKKEIEHLPFEINKLVDRSVKLRLGIVPRSPPCWPLAS
jgi:hypothetical protein